MGFYGKIYEQTGDVFNRATFKNAPRDTAEFADSDVTYFAIDATSHEDKLPFEAGNSWIKFVESFDAQGNQVCLVYHNKPQKEATGNSSEATQQLISQITRTPGESDFLALTDADSTLLTPEEKQALLDAQNDLLYFGDKILTWCPVRDDAGHIIRFNPREWKLGSIPRLADILSAEGRIVNLEDIVGIEEYPNDKGTLAARAQSLEDDFENVRQIADDAAELAEAADASATAAQKAAENAEKSAQDAQTSAENTATETAEFIAESTATLGRYDARIRGNTNAIGAGDSDTIETELDTDSLLDWVHILIGVLGEDYSEIRYNDADTITEQIHSNDADIAKLQKDLAQEVTDRKADVDAEESARKQAITDLTDTMNTTVARIDSDIAAHKSAVTNTVNVLYDDMAQMGRQLLTQIESNDADIATLQTNLAKEISDRDAAVTNERTRAVGVEEQLRTDLTAENTRAIGVEQGLDSRLTTAENNIRTNTDNINANAQAIAKLNGNDTVVGSIAYLIHAETDARSTSEGVLRADINTLNSTLESLAALVEAQQSTITELQNKVADLESQLNPEPPETPSEGEDESEEPIE